LIKTDIIYLEKQVWLSSSSKVKQLKQVGIEMNEIWISSQDGFSKILALHISCQENKKKKGVDIFAWDCNVRGKKVATYADRKSAIAAMAYLSEALDKGAKHFQMPF